MKKMTFEEYKNLILDVLLKIHNFCEENNINYSLSCGSLLGAIRHQGYIPWDDDIDIQLLREDYNKLIKLFPIEYKGISLMSLERNKKWDRAYAKAYYTKSLEIEASTSKVNNIGVGIDVYPIDIVPDSETEWKNYNSKRLFFQRIYIMKVLRFRKGRALFKNIQLALFKIVLLPFSLRKLAIIIDKMAMKYNGTNSDYLFENCQGVGRGRNRFSRRVFDKYIDVEFEGHYLKAPCGFDDYLTATYGDYMQLPPIEKRVSHHDFIAYWK